MLSGHARIVSTDDVEPAVGSLDDAVGTMLRIPQLGPPLGLTIGPAVTIPVSPPPEAIVARVDQVIPVKTIPFAPLVGRSVNGVKRSARPSPSSSCSRLMKPGPETTA